MNKSGRNDDTGAELFENHEKKRKPLGQDIMEEYGGENAYVFFFFSLVPDLLSWFRLLLTASYCL